MKRRILSLSSRTPLFSKKGGPNSDSTSNPRLDVGGQIGIRDKKRSPASFVEQKESGDKKGDSVQIKRGTIWLHNRVVQEILVLFVLSLVPLVWYKTGTIVLGHDIGFPVNVGDWFKDKLWLWGFKESNFGSDYSFFAGFLPIHGLEAFLSWLGFSVFWVQKLTFVFWFFAPSLAMYYFVYSFYPEKEYRWFRVFSFIFYVFNFFILTRFIIFERAGFSMMVALPITLTLTLKYLQYKLSLFKTVSFLGLLFLFFNGSTALFLGILLMVSAIFLLFYIFIEVRSKKELGRVILINISLLTILVLTNIYWLLPFFHSNPQVYETIIEKDFSGLVNWLKMASQSSSFLNLFKLQGVAEYHTSLEHYSDFFVKTELGLFLSGLLPVIIFSSFLFARKRKKDKFFILFFSLLALIFIFLSAGGHPPFDKYYIWMMENFPFFAVYRSPVYKFFYIVVLAYAFLFGFVLQKLISRVGNSFLIKEWFKKDISTILGILFIILILGFNYLYFDTRIFKLSDSFTLRVSLPDYTLEAMNFMKEKLRDERILLLPKLVENYGGVDVYNWGYWSILPFPRLLFSQPTIVNQGMLPVNKMVDLFYQSINKNDFQITLQYAQIFNIKYFLLRHDFSYKWNVGSDDPLKIKAILDKNKDYFSSINKFGEWEIYELNINSVPGEIFISKEPSYIPNLSNSVISPKLEFSEVNPTKYRVKVKDAIESFYLVFLESFHKEWNLYLAEQKSPFYETWLKEPISKDRHFLANGYANSWFVDLGEVKKSGNYVENPDGSIDFELIVEFWPQRLFYLGLMISGLTLLGCLGYLGYDWRRKRRIGLASNGDEARAG